MYDCFSQVKIVFTNYTSKGALSIIIVVVIKINIIVIIAVIIAFAVTVIIITIITLLFLLLLFMINIIVFIIILIVTIVILVIIFVIIIIIIITTTKTTIIIISNNNNNIIIIINFVSIYPSISKIITISLFHFDFSKMSNCPTSRFPTSNLLYKSVFKHTHTHIIIFLQHTKFAIFSSISLFADTGK